MSSDKHPAKGAPAPATSSKDVKEKRPAPASAPDAQKAEPVPHQRPPVRSDDN
jgi:hypothetical protein